MKFKLGKSTVEKLDTFSAQALRAQLAIIKAAHYIDTDRIDEAIAEILAERERMDNEIKAQKE